MTNKQKATLSMVLSVVMFSFMQLFISLADPNISIFQQVFFRNTLGVIVAYVFIRKDKASLFGEKKYQPYLFGRSFFGFLGLILAFYSMRHAALADATIVNRTGPFFTTLFSVLFLKERLNRLQIPILLIIFAGGWIAADPSFSSDFIPLGAAFLSAIANGICYTLLRYFGDKVHPMTVIMHFSAFSVLASIPFMMMDFYMPTLIDFVYLLMIAVGGSLGQIFLTYAYKLAPASEVAIYDQLSIIFAVVIGIIFLHQIPTINSLLGGILIVAASVLAYLYNNGYLRKSR